MDCVVTPEAIAELVRLNARLVKATCAIPSNELAVWKASVALLDFIKTHPTLIPELAHRARRKKR